MAMSSEEFNNWVSTIGNVVNQAGQTVSQVYQQVQDSRNNRNNGSISNSSTNMYGNDESKLSPFYIVGGLAVLIIGILILKK